MEKIQWYKVRATEIGDNTLQAIYYFNNSSKKEVSNANENSGTPDSVWRDAMKCVNVKSRNAMMHKKRPKIHTCSPT